MKKVCVIGHFGFGKNMLNGQTIKTKIVTEQLERQFGTEQVIKIDTHGGFSALPKIVLKMINAFEKTENIIIFPAHNGIKVFAPLCVYMNQIFHRKLHYVVIGGWLPTFLKRKENLKKKLEQFDGIYVETNTMKSALEVQGFENIYVMPNCKKLTVLSENELVYPFGMPYKLCTFSRVMKEKGIEDAVNAVVSVNTDLGVQVFSLDIYGQVDEAQTVWFDSLQKEFPSYIRYGGVIPFDKSVDVLKDYFALLFPSYYDGEGFAGTLIDAYSAGVPVIASDWKYNVELINENVGWIYPTRNQQAFVDILKSIAENSTLVLAKKRLCLKEADKYKIDKAVRILINRLEAN